MTQKNAELLRYVRKDDAPNLLFVNFFFKNRNFFIYPLAFIF